MLAALVALCSGVLLPIAVSNPPLAAVGHRIASAAPAVSELVEPPPGIQDGDPGYAESMSPFDDALPAIANLGPDLRTAMQDAAREAQADGIDLYLTSGWRSAFFQRWLLDDAIAKYGSVEEASRYVSTPEKSKHVSGDAVDVGPTDGAYWMAGNGYRFGLCQIYANEIWHYELATTPGGACPALLRDASAG